MPTSEIWKIAHWFVTLKHDRFSHIYNISRISYNFHFPLINQHTGKNLKVLLAWRAFLLQFIVIKIITHCFLCRILVHWSHCYHWNRPPWQWFLQKLSGCGPKRIHPMLGQHMNSIRYMSASLDNSRNRCNWNLLWSMPRNDSQPTIAIHTGRAVYRHWRKTLFNNIWY